jgi:hypothetical protein
MKYRLLFLLAAFSLSAYPQAWSTFLDPSRAIDWTSAGFAIPTYGTNCATQPTLLTGSGNAAANRTAIQNALASCDATHNVVNISAGTFYVAGITFPAHGYQVLRGAGPNATTLISTGQAGCNGQSAGLCMTSSNWTYNGSDNVQPPSGSNQCSWSAGYAKGSTALTLSSCGGVPPLHKMLILDQANDASDNGGIYICDERTNASCNYDGTGAAVGRNIGGISHSQMQVTYITGVTSLGGGSYSVTVSPGVYFNNIRSGQSPGAWWSDITQNNGIENMTIDGTADDFATVTMFDCYQCWVRNTRLLNGARASIILFQSGFSVIRDNYFYQAQGHEQVSYNIDPEIASGILVENNVFQQVTVPILFNAGSGSVIAYNFAINDIAFTGYTWPAFVSHNAGNSMNLWEGNNFPGLESDNAWGSSSTQTFFRNMLRGWELSRTNGSVPVILRSYSRAYNIIGNVLGQPSYHSRYQANATSTTAGVGGSTEDTSIYSLGWKGSDACGNGTPRSSPYCDPLTFSLLMRWGNYDTVTAGVKWDSTEAAPAAAAYTGANLGTSYFNALAHTLPSSLYLASKPSWWPSAKAWPAVGPDVSSGNLGICSGGTYAGAQATASGQCTGGTLTSAWAGHGNSIPAQDCYLNVMKGSPDGTGSVLNFDASLCSASSVTRPASPTEFKSTVH